jgi:hypothetical protein
MPQLPPEEAQRLASAIGWIHVHVGPAEFARASVTIAPTSARAVDAAGPAGDLAFEMANLKLSTAEDHLLAAAALMSQGIPRYACYTVLRGTIEAAAAAFWLVGPKLTPRDRHGRSLTAQLLNLLATKREYPSNDITERVQGLRKAAAGLELKEVLDRDGRLIAFGARRPSITQQIKSLPIFDSIERSTTYSTVSAFAHGEMWAILKNRKTLSMNDSHSVLELSVDVEMLLDFASRAVDAYDHALSTWLRLTAGSEAEDAWIQVRGPMVTF